MLEPIEIVAGEEGVFRMIRDRFATDAASRHLSMKLASAEAGRVSMTMPITPEMLNGHGILHGGYIFLIADTCFAFVCESTNHPSVSRQAEITYIAPGIGAESLHAVGEQRTRYGRNNIVDVSVHSDTGKHLAEVRVFGVQTRVHHE